MEATGDSAIVKVTVERDARPAHKGALPDKLFVLGAGVVVAFNDDVVCHKHAGQVWCECGIVAVGDVMANASVNNNVAANNKAKVSALGHVEELLGAEAVIAEGEVTVYEDDNFFVITYTPLLAGSGANGEVAGSVVDTRAVVFGVATGELGALTDICRQLSTC